MDILRNRIWKEMYDAKYHSCYLAGLVRTHRKRSIRLTAIIAISSTLGLTLQKVTEWAATVGLAIALVGSLLKHLGPVWLMSDEQLSTLDREHAFYELYCSQLERLWIHYEQNSIDEKEALKQFFELKEREGEHVIPVNQIAAYFKDETKHNNLIHDKVDQYVQAVFAPQTTDPATT